MRFVKLLTSLLVSSYVREAARQRKLAKKELANGNVHSDNIIAIKADIAQLEADIVTEESRQVVARNAAVNHENQADRLLDKADAVSRFLQGVN